MVDNIKLAKYDGTCVKDGTTWSGTLQGPNTPNHITMRCPMSFYNGFHNISLDRVFPPICRHPKRTFDQGSMTGSCPDCGERWAE